MLETSRRGHKRFKSQYGYFNSALLTKILSHIEKNQLIQYFVIRAKFFPNF